ncbi:hypothetical protein BUALT_Bualt02G0068300 [Buddleja alternifolia]|uniref:Leucine-rich repeat-containing N-terminal plant-type domain-containing protein n=1 Tax=Buddleja alternifolia TaxID=168488 RepID=A0AAV6XZM5_9LAMI|nr:hypothetical protein BUALT_Bualt02G0068300 [Buddleja alternifolia]
MDFLPSLAWLLLLLFMIKVMFPMQSDVDCVRSMKESLQDPLDKLTTWQFNDIHAETQYDNYICSFNGVECWNSSEGIANCSSLFSFDFSNNHLYESIPSHISNTMAYVASLDLSSNNFSSQIPAGIANCSYLNVLKLN